MRYPCLLHLDDGTTVTVRSDEDVKPTAGRVIGWSHDIFEDPTEPAATATAPCRKARA